VYRENRSDTDERYVYRIGSLSISESQSKPSARLSYPRRESVQSAERGVAAHRPEWSDATEVRSVVIVGKLRFVGNIEKNLIHSIDTIKALKR
jgi:hypothetical protein